MYRCLLVYKYWLVHDHYVVYGYTGLYIVAFWYSGIPVGIWILAGMYVLYGKFMIVDGRRVLTGI